MSTIAETAGGSRIDALRDQVMNRGGSFPAGFHSAYRSLAVFRVWSEERSVAEIRAALLRELVAIAPIEIPDGWTLAGEHLLESQAALFDDGRGESSPLGDFGVSNEDVPAVYDAVDRYQATRLRAFEDLGDADPAQSVGRGTWQEDGAFLAGGWVENHSIRDYAAVLHYGFSGLKEQIADQRAKAGGEGDFAERDSAWRSMESVCDAGILLGRRYSDAAARLASEAGHTVVSPTADEPARRGAPPSGEDATRVRARLERMADACRRVPERPARSLHEAVQALWLTHVLSCGEDGINANSIGRLDQILFPYYTADIEAGRITREEAVELMQELACKLYLDYDVQAITLGGVDGAGTDAVNEMSYIILDATERVGFVRDLSVRLHAGSPPELVRRSCELIARGGGIPYFFNDAAFIPALVDRGIPVEDARDYSPIGCIELTIPGKANPHAVSGWFNALKCLELALHDGIDPQSGERWGPATGSLSDHPGFDSFYAAYRTQVESMAKRMVYHCNRGELAQAAGGPLPAWSLLTDACIERGRDITDGGARYSYHSICLMGVPNVADSLAAIKKLVFEDGSVDPHDLLQALAADFDGYEPLRHHLMSRAPKYGNDVAEVDDLAARVADEFIDLMDQMESTSGSRYFVHLFTFRRNLDAGGIVGATPDGRRAGEPIAYSLSAQAGRDEKGVTAFLSSLARLPHDRAGGASAAIVDMDPSAISGAKGAERLAQLVTSAFAMGVGQLQWNVVSAERLRLAQSDPEHYGNISVRVAGYSQMFKRIDREMQEHIIARTKHTR